MKGVAGGQLRLACEGGVLFAVSQSGESGAARPRAAAIARPDRCGPGDLCVTAEPISGLSVTLSSTARSGSRVGEERPQGLGEFSRERHERADARHQSSEKHCRAAMPLTTDCGTVRRPRMAQSIRSESLTARVKWSRALGDSTWPGSSPASSRVSRSGGLYYGSLVRPGYTV